MSVSKTCTNKYGREYYFVMKITIITINYNNAAGLEKTLQSINAQTIKEFEHIIVDGASTDASVDIIKKYDDGSVNRRWISEPDKGIYNAMNKGIQMARGEYLQFLNSGDCLADDSVTERMLQGLKAQGYPSILYGNMLKDMVNGKIVRDRCFAGGNITFMGFFQGTLNHSPAYIKRELFDKYGMYDESLKIVSDWKWYLQAIILNNEKPEYVDMDVTLFDMTGISETNKTLEKEEREKVLSELIPETILSDYRRWAFNIDQIKRLKRFPLAYRMVWFIERCLFKLEKVVFKTKNESRYR